MFFCFLNKTEFRTELPLREENDGLEKSENLKLLALTTDVNDECISQIPAIDA